MPARDPSRGTGTDLGDEDADFHDTVISAGEQLDELVGRSSTDLGEDEDPDMDAATVLGVGGQARAAAAPAAPAAPAPKPRVTAPQARVAAEGGRRPAPPEARAQPRPAAVEVPAQPRPEAAEPRTQPRPAAPEPRAQPRSNRPISPSDPAPVFRNDLQVARTAQGYIIRDPSTGQTFPFSDAEVSLARMFNGMRPISDVLETSARLGIPTNFESLQGFILKLEQQGLLAAAAGEAGSGQAWQARVQWEHGVRSMFQSGIRLLRTGRPAEAAGYFEAILQQDPANLEAREMLEICQSTPQVAAAAVAHLHPPTQPPPFGMPHPGTQPPPFAMTPHPGTQPPFPPYMGAPMAAPPPAGPAPAAAAPRRIARPTGSQGHAPPQAEMLAVAPPFPAAPASRWRVLLPILILVVAGLGVGAFFLIQHLRAG